MVVGLELLGGKGWISKIGMQKTECVMRGLNKASYMLMMHMSVWAATIVENS